MPKDTEKTISGYHAHVYYRTDNRNIAAILRDQLATKFRVLLGRWHDRPVGPHPTSMYQVIFSTEDFGTIVPWLMLNRQGLDILVHPETGNDLEDHRDNAIWLGEKLTLNLAIFEEA